MPRITRKESRDNTREQLRRAARAEFAQYGVASSSIDRITEAAGYSRGAFYSNYSSKNELALELLTENSCREIAAWECIIATSNCASALIEGLERHFDLMATQREWWLLNAELRVEAERDPEFRALYDVANTRIFEQVQAMVGNLCRFVSCEDTVDPDYVAFVLHTFASSLPLEHSVTTLKGTSPGKLLTRLLLDLLTPAPKLTRDFPSNKRN